MPTMRNLPGAFGTQREEESEYPRLNPAVEIEANSAAPRKGINDLSYDDIGLTPFRADAPSPAAWESYWRSDPGGGWNPMKGALSNLWDMARDPVWFVSGEEQNGFEKTVSMAYNSFLSAVSAGYLEGRHATEPENETLKSFASALGTMAGFAAMLAGPSKLIKFLGVPRHLAPVVTGGVYGFGKKTGYGWDGLMSHDDIAARFKNAVMDAGMFAGFHFATEGLGAALSRVAPKAVGRFPKTAGAIGTGVPFGAAEAGFAAYEGAPPKEIAARGLGGFLGGAPFGAYGAMKGAKAVEGLPEQVEAIRQTPSGQAPPPRGRPPTALQPHRIEPYLKDALRQAQGFHGQREGFTGPPRPEAMQGAERFVGPRPTEAQMQQGRPGFAGMRLFDRAVATPEYKPGVEVVDPGRKAPPMEGMVPEQQRTAPGTPSLFNRPGQTPGYRPSVEVPEKLGAGIATETRAPIQERALAILHDINTKDRSMPAADKAKQAKFQLFTELKGIMDSKEAAREVGKAFEEYDMHAARVPSEVSGRVQRGAEGEAEGREYTVPGQAPETTMKPGDMPGDLTPMMDRYLAEIEAKDDVAAEKTRAALLLSLKDHGLNPTGRESIRDLEYLVQEAEGGADRKRVETQRDIFTPAGQTRYEVEPKEQEPVRQQEPVEGRARTERPGAWVDTRTATTPKRIKMLEDLGYVKVEGKEKDYEKQYSADQELPPSLIKEYGIKKQRTVQPTGEGRRVIEESEIPEGTTVKTKVGPIEDKGTIRERKVEEKVDRKRPNYTHSDEVVEELYQRDLASSEPKAKERVGRVEQLTRDLLQARENRDLEPAKAEKIAKGNEYREEAVEIAEARNKEVTAERDKISQLEAKVEDLDAERGQKRQLRSQIEAEEKGIVEDRDVAEPLTAEEAEGQYREETDKKATKTLDKKVNKLLKDDALLKRMSEEIQVAKGQEAGDLSDSLYKHLQRKGLKGQELVDLYNKLSTPEFSERTGTLANEVSLDALGENVDALTEAVLPGARGPVSSIYRESRGRIGVEKPDIVSHDIGELQPRQVVRDPRDGSLWFSGFMTRLRHGGGFYPAPYKSAAKSAKEKGAWLLARIDREGNIDTTSEGPAVRAVNVEEMKTWDNLGRQPDAMEEYILDSILPEMQRALYEQQASPEVKTSGRGEKAKLRSGKEGDLTTTMTAAEAEGRYNRVRARMGTSDSLNELNQIRGEYGLKPLKEFPPDAFDRIDLSTAEKIKIMGTVGKEGYRAPREITPELLRELLTTEAEVPVGKTLESPQRPRELTTKVLESEKVEYETWFNETIGKKKEVLSAIDKEVSRETTPEERRELQGEFNIYERAMFNEMVDYMKDVLSEEGRPMDTRLVEERVLEAMIDGKIPKELESYMQDRC